MSKALRDFVLGEMQSRQLSLRQFAEIVGVSHATMGKLINSPDSGFGFDLLIKLATATKTDIGILARLAAPHAAISDTRVDQLAARIGRLPPDQQRVIDLMLLGAYFKQGEDADDSS